MLSNSIWSMPQSTRAGEAGTATIFFRCGSQQGKAARTVADTITEEELTGLTIEFVATEITQFRSAQARKQKNAARNLKKFLDARDIHLIEESDAEDAGALASRIVAG